MVKKIGDYMLERLIGHGNYGSVYGGYHITTRQPIAAKTVSINTLQGKLLQQLESEIKVLKSLRNPYIIKLLEVYKTQNNVYLIMEHCSGGDLAEYLKKVGRVEETLAKRWLSQLVEAFCAMQQSQIMHRDLKLANILITAHGDIKVCDFGFARYLGNDLADTQLGTPIFMAPEIFNSEKYSYKADVWSLGVLSYEILVGHSAFQCKNLAQLKVLQKVPLRFPAELSDSAKEFVQWMMTYDHNSRPSFEDLKTHPFFSVCLELDEFVDLAEPSDEEFEMLESIEELNPEAVQLESQLAQVEEILEYYHSLIEKGNGRAALCVVFYAQKMFVKYLVTAQELCRKFQDPISNDLKDRLTINCGEVDGLIVDLTTRQGIDVLSLESWIAELVLRLLDDCEERVNTGGSIEDVKKTLRLLAVAIDLQPTSSRALELFANANQRLIQLKDQNNSS